MRRYYGSNTPNKKWNLGNYLGNGFEEFILKVIKKQLKNFFPNVKIKPTKRVSDGGKDIIIYSNIPKIEILGQKFISLTNDELIIYFECKSTNSEILRYDKISTSVSRVQHEKIDYYVLVTNSTILPQAYWYINEEFKTNSNRIAFRLIDSFLLGSFLVNYGFKGELNNPYDENDSADFYYDYQTESLQGFRNNYNIYINFRNYSDKEKHCELQLQTDIDWTITEDIVSFVIPPMGVINKKIIVKQDHFDGIEDLLFRIQVNGNESTVIISGINGYKEFETPFFGENRKALLRDIIKELKSSNPPRVLCFWGDAGIGKSRMTKELFDNLKGTIFDLYIYKAQKNSLFLDDIQTFLYQNEYIKNKNYTSFSQMIKDCNNKYDNHAIIVIDDLHFLSKKFLDEIKLIKSIEAPITLLLCGRTDYSLGDISYMSFVYWTKTELPKFSYKIEPLSNEETKNFIRALIDGIPDSALERLFELSMNNPLFIVQYVEYLLDCKLVKLINRNTVGIVNINHFHSKNRIPKKISEIYKLRLLNLQKQDIGNACIDILYTLVLCNGKVDYDYFNKYILKEYTCLEELLNRRLLKFEYPNKITFIHESLFLYLNDNVSSKKSVRKTLSQNLLQLDNLNMILKDFQIGRLYLFSKDYNNAAKYFAPIILWLKEINNISNLNVNLEYYDYLNDIFEIFRQKKPNQELAKKALMIRIYITLHHLTPINAVDECDDVFDKLKKYKLIDDEIYNLSIKELKAHALMNSALYQDGETLLKEIQVQWICDNNILDNQTKFDLFDRLSSIYRHFNLKMLAEKYNNLSRNLADSLQDPKLKMLSNRTKYKIYLYTDFERSYESIKETKELNQIEPLERIDLDNSLDECGFSILTNQVDNIDNMIKKVNRFLEISELKEFHRAKIHTYFLLAICNLIKNTDDSLILANKYIEMAIDLSTSYGIVKYLWRLNNLNGILKMRLNYDGETIYKIFCTVFDILRNRGLLYIGDCDLCHGNILALSNVGYYLQEHKYETLFHEKMALVTYNEKSRKIFADKNSSESPMDPYLIMQYNLAKNKKVLFTDFQPKYVLREKKTGYIIVL